MTADRFANTTALNSARREAELRQLGVDGSPQEELDLVVIGGGITGAGIALDAVTRGLSVVLLEKHDLAFGTSRWSSKLAHGGLRYLSKGRVGIARHSALERGRLMKHNAPHLVRALAQVTPLDKGTNLFQKAAVRAGYYAGDLLRASAHTPGSILPQSARVDRRRALELCPTARQEGLKGAWVNYDGQMIDDARMVTAVARTAAREGAKILTYCEVLEATGKSVRVRDTLGDRTFDFAAHGVVNATGVWAGGLDPNIHIKPSRGTHLVLDAAALGNPTGALTVPLPGSVSRYLFAMPEQLGRVYLGLTDVETPGEIPEVPDTPEEDVDFLLENFNKYLERKLTRDDVLGTFTGIRPLIDDGEGGESADVSRKHATIVAENGLVSIVGGKFTEYRQMAEEAVDEVVRLQDLHAGDCRTANFPLVGAPKHRDSLRVRDADLIGLPKSMIDRFGYEAPAVMASCTMENPLGKVAGLTITCAELEYAATHEGALTVDDILDRRTRIGLVPADRERALAAAEEALEAAKVEVGRAAGEA